MATIFEGKYDGNGGNEQRVFIKDARIGWKAIMADPNRHLSVGFTQYDYLETLGGRLGGQARRVLDNYVDKWDCTKEDHVNYEEAVTREVDRAHWRRYYKRQAVYDLCQVQAGAGVAVPTRPDELDDAIEEPPELDEFLSIIQETFQAASAVYLEDLNAFKPFPRETLLKLADRFDEVAIPLLTAGLMTSRGLALTLRQHLPIHIRKATLLAMKAEDKKRIRRGDALINKDELMKMAQAEEGFLLEFEAEMRAAGQVPDPRPVEEGAIEPPLAARPHRQMADRLGPQIAQELRDVLGMVPAALRDRVGTPPTRDIRERLGTRIEGTPLPDTRSCHQCGRVGHLARNCSAKPTTGAILPNNRADPLAAHKTAGHTCESCGKPGHTTAQCWTAHPELVPEALAKKRQQAMSASARKKRRAADHISPGYRFQGMALTYQRPALAMAQRRSTRVPQPTVAVQEAQPVKRRVKFTIPTPQTTLNRLTTPTPSVLPPLLPSPTTKSTGEEATDTAHLPQTFPHGLPPSSLEPGTTDQQYPPTPLFPEPPLGDGESPAMETPLQTVVHLRHATANLQHLIADLSASLWAKATDQERRFPFLPQTETEQLPPVIPVADRHTTHYTPVFLYTENGALDANGYVPRETIIDTGASKVMFSKSFANAMGLDLNDLNDGAKFVTASGAVEHPLGSTKSKVMFTLARGTEQECKAAIYVTIVDTSAYDALLGMEFITAMGGAYDTWTELFKYRWLGADGAIHNHELSAPCHTKTPPMMAWRTHQQLGGTSGCPRGPR